MRSSSDVRAPRVLVVLTLWGSAFLPLLRSEVPSLTVTSGLADMQVLQRSADGQTVFGTCTRSGTLQWSVNGGPWAAIASVKQGNWSARLPSLATGGPYEIGFRLDSRDGGISTEVHRRNVLVGDLWVLSGQSNMVGRATIDENQTPSAAVRTFTPEGAWAPALDPLHEERPGRNGSRIGAGLGVEFGKEMYRRTGVPVGLIPCAKGGTAIALWDPALAPQGEKSLYGNMLRRIRLAGGRIAGVLWYQGENDSGENLAREYGPKFEALVAALRRDLRQPGLPFYYAQLARYANRVEPFYQNFDLVREAQRLAEETIPNARMVATIDLELGDLIHLSRSSLHRLGRRFAVAAAGNGGPRLERVYWRSRFELRVRFRRVSGKLQAPGGRVFGFELSGKESTPALLIYGAALDEAVNEVVLGINPWRSSEFPPVLDLWYGRGVNPICNLADAEDLAVPTFGPVRVPPRPPLPSGARP